MSPQQNRFRFIILFSRPRDRSRAQFQEALLASMKEWDKIPLTHRNHIKYELCFSMGDAEKPLQFANVSGSAAECDAIFISDFESREQWEEVSVSRVTARHSIRAEELTSDESPPQFQQAFRARMKEWDAIPIVRRNCLNSEVCFSMDDAANILQAANVAGPPTAYDIILISDYESRDGRRRTAILKSCGCGVPQVKLSVHEAYMHVVLVEVRQNLNLKSHVASTGPFPHLLSLLASQREPPSQFQDASRGACKSGTRSPSCSATVSICFSMNDVTNVLQSTNVTGPSVAYDAIAIMDFEKRERWEEVSVSMDFRSSTLRLASESERKTYTFSISLADLGLNYC
ncbi:hypothetical protein DFH09DRAFT_1305544 [Mycena vulgaris]|nr:hypothetical protein DFH09DRAFT_1305544 [Mycena vulgaris]